MHLFTYWLRFLEDLSTEWISLFARWSRVVDAGHSRKDLRLERSLSIGTTGRRRCRLLIRISTTKHLTLEQNERMYFCAIARCVFILRKIKARKKPSSFWMIEHGHCESDEDSWKVELPTDDELNFSRQSLTRFIFKSDHPTLNRSEKQEQIDLHFYSKWNRANRFNLRHHPRDHRPQRHRDRNRIRCNQQPRKNNARRRGNREERCTSSSSISSSSLRGTSPSTSISLSVNFFFSGSNREKWIEDFLLSFSVEPLAFSSSSTSTSSPVFFCSSSSSSSSSASTCFSSNWKATIAFDVSWKTNGVQIDLKIGDLLLSVDHFRLDHRCWTFLHSWCLSQFVRKKNPF